MPNTEASTEKAAALAAQGAHVAPKKAVVPLLRGPSHHPAMGLHLRMLEPAGTAPPRIYIVSASGKCVCYFAGLGVCAPILSRARSKKSGPPMTLTRKGRETRVPLQCVPALTGV